MNLFVVYEIERIFIQKAIYMENIYVMKNLIKDVKLILSFDSIDEFRIIRDLFSIQEKENTIFKTMISFWMMSYGYTMITTLFIPFVFDNKLSKAYDDVKFMPNSELFLYFALAINNLNLEKFYALKSEIKELGII